MILLDISAAILDDQSDHLEHLEKVVKSCEGIKSVAGFEHPAGLMRYLSENHADIVFLDIELGKDNGLDLPNKLPEKCEHVFVTSYPDFAIDGHRSDPLGFIVKPASQEDVMNILEKFRIRRSKLPGMVPEYYFIRTSGKTLEKIILEDICYIEAKGDYVLIQTLQEQKLACLSLKKLGSQLPPGFVQSHRSFIINTKAIQKLEDDKVCFRKGSAPIGRKYRQALTELVSRHSISR